MTELNRNNIGFLLAKASQRWNELLYAGFRAEGYPQVRPSFGAVLVPLYEEDGLRLSELAKRARLSKQTMTTMIRLVAKAKLVTTRPDPEDGRATCVFLTAEARRFQPVAEKILARLERRAIQIEGRDGSEQIRTWLRQFAEI